MYWLTGCNVWAKNQRSLIIRAQCAHLTVIKANDVWKRVNFTRLNFYCRNCVSSGQRSNSFSCFIHGCEAPEREVWKHLFVVGHGAEAIQVNRRMQRIVCMCLQDLLSFSNSFAHEITVIGTFFCFVYEFWYLKLTHLEVENEKKNPKFQPCKNSSAWMMVLFLDSTLQMSKDDRQMCRWYAVIRHFASTK